MTAEERMAYFQGEKRRDAALWEQKQEKNMALFFLKLRFMIALILFILFLSLDYTGYQIHGIGSREIIQEVEKDFDLIKTSFAYNI